MIMTVSEEKVLDELKFLLEDEARIVTYKYVSHNFSVHVNTAKEYLHALHRTLKSSGDEQINALHFICGSTRSNPTALKALLVSEDQLSRVRDSFGAVLSQHVYSLQRRAPRNVSAIHGADLQEGLLSSPLDVSRCAISNSSVRVTDPIAAKTNGRSDSKPVPFSAVDQKKLSTHTVGGTATLSAASPTHHLSVKKSDKSSPKTSSLIAARSSPRKKGSNADAASRTSPRKKESNTDAASRTSPRKKGSGADATSRTSPRKKGSGADAASRTSPRKKGSGADAAGRKGPGIAAMFAHAASSKAARQTEKASTTERTAASPEKDAGDDKGERGDRDGEGGRGAGNDAHKSEQVTFGRAKSVKPGNKAQKKRKSGNKRNSVDDKQQQNKRRRILAAASDSSEDERSEPEECVDVEEDAAPAVDSESEEPRPVPSQADSAVPRRARKLVDKTFLDPEGFMVTKKVYESCSDEETEAASSTVEVDNSKCNTPVSGPSTVPEVLPSKNDTSASGKTKPTSKTDKPASEKVKQGPAHKTKQANIMNFFKKK